MKNLLEINDKQMEFFQKGQKGKAILIVTGMACSFEEWHLICEALSLNDQIIMFHRPGLGASDIGDEERTTAQACKEINILLDRLKITEPILLIGHSYGGLIAQHYAKLKPQQIDGMILVDSTSEDLKKLNNLDLPVLNEGASDEEWIESCRIYEGMNEKELAALLQTTLSISQERLPESIQQKIIDFQYQPNLYKAMKSEVANWVEDAARIKALGSLEQLPLIVIGRDKSHMVKMGVEEGLPEGELALLEGVWEELVSEQAGLSSNSKLIFAEAAGHSIYLDRPEVIIRAVADIKGMI